jgi:hypothetical protein
VNEEELPREVERIAWSIFADVIEGGGSKEATTDGWKISARSAGLFRDVTISKGDDVREFSHMMFEDPSLNQLAARNYRSKALRCGVDGP